MSTSPTEAPTQAHPALATFAGEQCTSCGASLAPDQRYCVACGQRRGGTSLPAVPTTAVAAAPVAAAPSRGRGRNTVNTTLIAGVGTLLLAMGVGVLIGRSSQKSAPPSAAASRFQVVTVGGGGGASPTASASTSSAGTSSAKSKHGKKTTSAAAKGGAAATQAAKQHVKGANVELPKTTVVKVGQKGHGPGYEKGKFTGNFFGGG